MHQTSAYHVELVGSLPDLFILIFKNDLITFKLSDALLSSGDTIRIVKGG